MGKYWYLTDMGLQESTNTDSSLFKSYGTIYIDNDTGILQYIGTDENNNPAIKDVSINGFCKHLKNKSINSNGKSYFNSVNYSDLSKSYFWKTPNLTYDGYFTEDLFPTSGENSVWFGKMVFDNRSSPNYLSETPNSISATLTNSILTLTIFYSSLNRIKNNHNYFYAFRFHFNGTAVGENFFTPITLNNFSGERNDNWLSGIKAKVIINGTETPETDINSTLSDSSPQFIKCGTNGNVVIYPKGRTSNNSINDFDITVNSLKIILTYEIAPQNFIS